MPETFVLNFFILRKLFTRIIVTRRKRLRRCRRCNRTVTLQCETHSQCVSLASPREPLKLSLSHSIVCYIALIRKHGCTQTVVIKESRAKKTCLLFRYSTMLISGKFKTRYHNINLKVELN